MKLFVTKLLIISLLAISLHGFGTDEKTVSPVSNITEVQLSDFLGDNQKPSETLTAACDICVVVHQYLVSKIISVNAKPAIKLNLLAIVALPPNQAPADILHPPII
ncbi:MAG: hypothetical protein L3J04_06680 [Robiginitomaculum sp.]|nr:hypothetical protein [Robiginitomaculum sp.]